MSSLVYPALVALALIAGCTSTASTPMRLGPDGRPVAVVYRIAERDVPQIQARMRDAINTVRQQQGLAPVEFDVALTSAAATQARDMALQGRPWHFGSDGSSPIDRVRRVGYTGHFLGETLSETYETELETLTAWLTEADTRGIILDPRARQLGFAWHQDANGKLWWVLTTGVDDGSGLVAQQGQSQAPVAMTAPNRG
ncbi:CAP domain-containing protein [Pararhodobacter zhoushanensis]|uniref:CAP domain-containing protein n=1 Tax=Pararhodobacter zhoushanensis TaxID=2479545 RepID=UPI000F8E90C5|nr:CAP domain-containing protein [Pararhodobacter zhoushanensis]